MNSDHHLHFVYLSQLAPGHDGSTFVQICQRARGRNLERGIAGALLFDGQRFVHWVYGARSEVRQLMGLIALDTRHTALSVRLEQMLPPGEPQPSWRTGTVEPRSLDDFAGLQRNDIASVLEALRRLIDSARLDPPLAGPVLWQ